MQTTLIPFPFYTVHCVVYIYNTTLSAYNESVHCMYSLCVKILYSPCTTYNVHCMYTNTVYIWYNTPFPCGAYSVHCMYSFIFVKISVPAGARLNVSLPAGQAKRRKLFKLFTRLDFDFYKRGLG